MGILRGDDILRFSCKLDAYKVTTEFKSCTTTWNNPRVAVPNRGV